MFIYYNNSRSLIPTRHTQDMICLNESSYHFKMQTFKIGGAAIAQWNRLRLPSCRPGFESQARNLRFLFIVFVLYLSCEKNENKQKRGRVWPIFKKKKKKKNF